MDQTELNVPEVIGALVHDVLDGPPTTGMGRGSAMEREDQRRWREALEKRWQRIRAQVPPENWPEAMRFLDLIGAEMKFQDPRTSRVIRLDRTSTAKFSVIG